MNPRFFFLNIGLAAVLLAACSPQATQPPTALSVATQVPENTALPQVTNDAPTVVAAATSRGPNLEATDPATVSLAAGQLQLIEFFRFT